MSQQNKMLKHKKPPKLNCLPDYCYDMNLDVIVKHFFYQYIKARTKNIISFAHKHFFGPICTEKDDQTSN